MKRLICGVNFSDKSLCLSENEFMVKYLDIDIAGNKKCDLSFNDDDLPELFVINGDAKVDCFAVVKIIRKNEKLSISKIVVVTSHFSKIVKIHTEYNKDTYYCALDEFNNEFVINLLEKKALKNEIYEISLREDNSISKSFLSNYFITLFKYITNLKLLIEEMYSIIYFVTNADLIMIMMPDNLQTRVFIKAFKEISSNNIDDMLKFAAHDHFTIFKYLNYDYIEKIYSSDSKRDLNESKKNIDKILNSYFYTIIPDINGNPIATLHLGSFITNNFSSDSFMLALQELSFKMGFFIEKALNYEKVVNEGKELKTLFSKFIPSDIIDKMIEEGKVEREPERKEVAVIFSDIRSFTNITEANQPDDVINFLNNYFEEMVTRIRKFGGRIDKFIGDAIVAVFEKSENENFADNAVLAGIEMAKGLKKVDISRIKLPESGFGTGIGIHCGEMILGNVGSEQKTAYTMIGDVTGKAEELEGDTKKYHKHILFSKSIFDRLKIVKSKAYKIDEDIFSIDIPEENNEEC